jgi:hypothetical protein
MACLMVLTDIELSISPRSFSHEIKWSCRIYLSIFLLYNRFSFKGRPIRVFLLNVCVLTNPLIIRSTARWPVLNCRATARFDIHSLRFGADEGSFAKETQSQVLRSTPDSEDAISLRERWWWEVLVTPFAPFLLLHHFMFVLSASVLLSEFNVLGRRQIIDSVTLCDRKERYVEYRPYASWG